MRPHPCGEGARKADRMTCTQTLIAVFILLCGCRTRLPDELGAEVDAGAVPAVDMSISRTFDLRPAMPFWPMLGHDAQRTGRAGRLGPKTSQVKWTFRLDDGLVGLVVGGDGTIYAGLCRKLEALDPGNGSVRWTRSFSSIAGQLALGTDGTIYVLDYVDTLKPSCALHAVDAGSHADRWVMPPIPCGGTSNPLVVASDGTIYLATFGGQVAAVDAQGHPRWSRQSGPRDVKVRTMALGMDGAVIVGGEYELTSLDPANGNPRWSIPAHGFGFQSATVGDDGSIYVISSTTTQNATAELLALSPVDGSVRFRILLDDDAFFRATISLGADGTLYVPDFGSGYFAITPEGHIKWHLSQAWCDQSGSGVVVAPDGTTYGNWYVSNSSVMGVGAFTATGAIAWGGHTGDGKVMALGPDGTLYQFINGHEAGPGGLMAIGP